MSVRTEIDRIIGAVEEAHTAIVEKGGTTVRPYLVGNLADAINTIPVSADPKLQTKTVSPATSTQTVKPDSGYDGLSQVTVSAMPTATQATPSISVSSAGLITASATQSAGYVAAGTKKATKQLTVQAAQIITPGTTHKTMASGRYLTGTQTIKGDSNLVAGNIKSGVSIFGVAGTFEGSGGGGGGGGSFVGEFASITDNGMYEPGSNEYIFDYSNNDVDLSAATCLLLGGRMIGQELKYMLCCYKLNDNYSVIFNEYDTFYIISDLITIDQATKTITAYGVLSSKGISYLKFKAFF